MTPQHSARRVTAVWQRGLSRRRFLTWALAGTAGVAAVAAGGFALLRRSPLDEQAKPAWAGGLSRQEYHLFDRARVALLPTEGTNLPDTGQVPVVANVQNMLGYMAPPLRDQLATGLGLFDNAAVVFHGRRFVDLDPATARDYFDAWSRGNAIQRTLATVIKQLVYSAYWSDPATWPPIEFDGPVSEQWGLAYLGNAPLPDDAPGKERTEENA
ncbi:gluconate 2-dehydrogenase subunit 3 family protein [Alloalcanivorax sp. C16-1]|uniref:gluconate 2-dehydrogenase subunit 3 family protein n=1 Tax=Alloalcanivorax sp. C16-1 TaxID=3390051 RepID=UPI0039709BF4